jgi:hypothetical protein
MVSCTNSWEHVDPDEGWKSCAIDMQRNHCEQLDMLALSAAD